jgi:hypothetical protein
MIQVLNILNTLAALATTIGVIVGVVQIRLGRKQAITQFEDSMAREYRELVSKLPTKILLGEEVSDEEYKLHFDELYHYIDLTNEQIFLRRNNRISIKTWENWQGGIKTNLRRPVFKKAWTEIKEKSNGDFRELRLLEEKNFASDPRTWRVS